MKTYFGIDIGGTTIKFGLFHEDGELLKKWEIPTRKENAGALILEDIAASLKENAAENGLTLAEISGIGVGVPGPVTEDGVVHQCPNLDGGF